MKIVHVIPALAKGGAERVVVDLANQAAKAGHEVTILTGAPMASAPQLHILRPEVALRSVGSGRASRIAAYASLLPWLIRNRRWLFDQDVIHCHLSFGSVFGSMTQRLRALYRRTSPVVVETYHAVGMAIPKKQRALHAALLSKRDAVAFMAEDTYWTRFRVDRPHRLFRTIPNGISPMLAIDAAASRRYRLAKTHIPEGAVVLGSIGRLVPARRPDLLIETFALLAKGNQGDLHLLLAGEGPERDRLLEQARAHGITDRVHLAGLVLEPREPLGLIDLYLTINVGPATGIAAMEAAFAGVPIIAVQLDDGYTSKPDDWIWSSSDLQQVAERAAALIADSNSRRDLAAHQKSYAERHHGIEAMAQSYFDLYREAASPKEGA